MKMLIVKSPLVNVEGFEMTLAGVGMEMSPVVWQHDRVYVPHGFRAGNNMARMILRTEVKNPQEEAMYTLRLKRHVEDSGIDFVHETPVLDYSQAMEIVHQLGFRKLSEVSRRRREARVDERMVLYWDKVEGIEDEFLKLEIELDDDDSVEAVRRDLLMIAQMLGQKTVTEQTYGEVLAFGVRDAEIEGDLA